MPAKIKTFGVDLALAERISDFRFERRIKTEIQAVTLLIEAGLEAFKREEVSERAE